MKKVAIYARVSTIKQEEQKTIESQTLALRELASKDELVEEYLDDGWSGTSLARPALDKLRDDIKENRFEILYVYDPDRLARNHIHLGIIQQELEKNKVQLIFFNTTYNNNAEGKLLFGMQGLIAEYEREKILERTRRGRVKKARQGFVIGSLSPFGYKYIKKTDIEQGYYKIDVEESNIVKLIFDLFLDKKSIRGVVTELDLRNIKPREGKRYWAKSSVARILGNTSYIGTTYYNKYFSYETENGKKYKRNIKTGKKLRKKEEWIPISVPQVVDNDTFYQAQRLLAFNRANLRPKKNKYLLSGIIQCGVCESSYVGDTLAYRCSSRHRKNVILEKCTNNQINVRTIESTIWGKVSDALKNPALIIRQVEKLAEKLKDQKPQLVQKIEEITGLMESKDNAKRKIIKSFTEGYIQERDFNLTIDELNKEINNLTSQRDSITCQMNNLAQEPKKVRDINHFCSVVSKRLAGMSDDHKKDILRLICEKVVYNRNKVTINAIIPQANLSPQSGVTFMSSKHYGQQPIVRFVIECKVK